jgi:MFS family permease
MALPEVLRNRDFDIYWVGVVLAQVGTRGTVAANLYQVYALTGSILQTGLVGGGQAVALLFLSPLGGAYADRLDRRRLLQWAQGGTLVVSLTLAVLTLSGQVEAWHVILSALFATAAATFDQPARQALIPALVPRRHLAQAIALVNPSRELAVLVGPALAGVLIAVGGPGLMYVVDVATTALLIIALAVLRVPVLVPGARAGSVFGSIAEGARYVVHRPLITRLMALDLSATVFAAYRVLLPALAVDVLDVGPTGYGLLSAAPSAGALLATYAIFRVVERSGRLGRVALVSTALYGGAVLVLAQSRWLPLALAAAVALGALDAMATTIRHAAVQVETPDDVRGRVTAFYQMASRGGPAVGDVAVGAFAAVVGPVVALSIGALGPVLAAAALLVRPNVIREYGSASAPPSDAHEATTQQPPVPAEGTDVRPVA